MPVPLPTQVLKSTSDLTPEDIQALYRGFNSPIAALDCGKKCAPHNPTGKPFCCDICQAVPAAYRSEWKYLKGNTRLWHAWQPQESGQDANRLAAETPKDMILLACLGPARCERDFRALSCRQFPFFPYVTSDYRFLGLAYDWEFESKCWMISNLSEVTQKYRNEFIRTYEQIFALFQSEFDNYAYHSEKMRLEFIRRRRRFPLLHRNGGTYWVSPASERMRRAEASRLRRFGPYR